MKLPKDIYRQTDKGIEPIPFAKALADFAKEHSIKKPEAEEALKDAVKGKGLESYELDADQTKKWKPIYKAAAKLLEDSAKNKQALNDQIAEQEESDKKRGELIVLAAEKGAELSVSFENSMVKGLQQMVGKKFDVSDTGLTIAEGATIDEEDAAKLIATLAESTERETKLRTTVNIALGDAIIAVKAAFAEADNLIEQVVATRGQSKHTVQDTERVVRFIDDLYERKDRPRGLTYTHWQEAKNHARDRKNEKKIPDAKVRKIIDKVLEGRDGKILSCADMRELLKAALPQTDPGDNGDGGDGEGEGDTGSTATEAKALYGYLFMEYADVNNVLFREELDKELLKETVEDGTQKYHVLSLADKAVLNSKGKVEARFVEEEEEAMPE